MHHLHCAADSCHYQLAHGCVKSSVSHPDKEPFWNLSWLVLSGLPVRHQPFAAAPGHPDPQAQPRPSENDCATNQQQLSDLGIGEGGRLSREVCRMTAVEWPHERRLTLPSAVLAHSARLPALPASLGVGLARSYNCVTPLSILVEEQHGQAPRYSFGVETTTMLRMLIYR